jgi:hypothetical protein
MQPAAFIRACAVFMAVMLAASGAFFTYASFDDPSAAAYALMTLAPSAILLWALPDKLPKNKWPPKDKSPKKKAR